MGLIPWMKAGVTCACPATDFCNVFSSCLEEQVLRSGNVGDVNKQ